MIPKNVLDRFWKRVKKSNKCWIWEGAGHSRTNHGMFGYNYQGRNITLYCHRVSYQQLIGEIPKGLVLDHLCSNPRCVNPTHLEPVTIGENVRRAKAKQTHCKRGHSLKENAYINKKNGHRTCRKCNNYRNQQRAK